MEAREHIVRRAAQNVLRAVDEDVYKRQKLDDPTPREEKQKWFDALCNAQNAISAEKHAAYIGRTVRVLVEGESDDADWPLSARTEGNRLVRMKGDKSLIGTFTTAKISGSNTWALYGAAEETI